MPDPKDGRKQPQQPRWDQADVSWTLHQLHDLGNLLTLASGCADSLRRSQPPNQTAITDHIELRQALDRAMQIARELILAGRADPADRQAIDLNQFVSSLQATLTRAVGRRTVLQITTSATASVVSASPVELDRIILNLVLNASDAMPERGVLTIDTVSHENDEQPDQSRAHVRLTVTDTGQGIPFHLRASVFEPFFTTKQHGTGIGLASVASTVQRLGGRLSIETQEGAGTRVHVDLPLLRPPAAADPLT